MKSQSGPVPISGLLWIAPIGSAPMEEHEAFATADHFFQPIPKSEAKVKGHRYLSA
jgi:hypothetical protein